MAKSGYTYAFARPQLKWLFSDYLQSPAFARVDLRPAEDPRVVTRLKIDAGTGTPSALSPALGATLRFQPALDANPLTFADVKAGTDAAAVRVCVFDRLGSGPTHGGAWATARAAQGGGGPPDLSLGARLSTEAAGAGLIVDPRQRGLAGLRCAWAVARTATAAAGVELRPVPGDVSLADATSLTVAYSPAAPFGVGGFTAGLEVRRGREVVVSVCQHLALRRGVKNPLEKGDVLGIVNYVDLGLQVASPVGAAIKGKRSAALPPWAPAPATGAPTTPPWAVGAAWQANKNVKAKAVATPAGAAVGVVLKSWSRPTLLAALSASVSWSDPAKPRLGAVIWSDNFSAARYERPRGGGGVTGRALVQRHEAMPDDEASAAGDGSYVPASSFGDARALGQEAGATARYV